MANENEQHINEARMVQAEVLYNLSNPTYRVGGLTLAVSMLPRIIFELGEIWEHQPSPFWNTGADTATGVGAWGGLGLIAVAYILENASKSIEARLPQNMQFTIQWDKIKTNK